MKILIADDDDVSRRVLQLTLAAAGHYVVATKNGTEALFALKKEAAPPLLAILDWMMPDIDGLEVCRRLRRLESATPAYIILLTAKTEKSDIVKGLEAGANDYITKPFDRNELQARVQVGITVVNLQQNLAARIKDLENALGKVKQLQEILPICSFCKQIRNDQNYWQQVDTYISEHTNTQFSHSVCPRCYESVVQPQYRDTNIVKNTSEA